MATESEQVQVLLYQKKGINTWKLVKGNYHDYTQAGKIDSESLDLVGLRIAREIKNLKSRVGEYTERNGFQFLKFYPAYSGSGSGRITNEGVNPIDPKVAFNLHWIILNEMSRLSEPRTIEAEAA